MLCDNAGDLTDSVTNCCADCIEVTVCLVDGVGQCGEHVRDRGRYTADRRQENTLDGAFRSFEGRVQIVVFDFVDLGKCVIHIHRAAFHAGKDGQHIGFQIFIHRSEETDGSSVLRHRVFHALQSRQHLEEGFSGRVTACGELTHHLLGIQSEGSEGINSGLATVLGSDVELLDSVTDLVDGENTGFCTVHQTGEEFIRRQAQGGILCRVFIQGIKQVAVLVGTVLSADCNDVVGFLGRQTEVFHQSVDGSGRLLHIVAKGVT